jgi:hypothetical protein
VCAKLFAGSVRIETYLPGRTTADTLVTLFKSGALNKAMAPFTVLSLINREDAKLTYEWLAGEWSACSIDCGKSCRYSQACSHKCKDAKMRDFHR